MHHEKAQKDQKRESEDLANGGIDAPLSVEVEFVGLHICSAELAMNISL